MSQKKIRARAAQRVPDGHAACVANMFVIRRIDLDDADGEARDFLLSSTARDVAHRLGLWQPGVLLGPITIWATTIWATPAWAITI